MKQINGANMTSRLMAFFWMPVRMDFSRHQILPTPSSSLPVTRVSLERKPQISHGGLTISRELVQVQRSIHSAANSLRKKALTVV